MNKKNIGIILGIMFAVSFLVFFVQGKYWKNVQTYLLQIEYKFSSPEIEVETPGSEDFKYYESFYKLKDFYNNFFDNIAALKITPREDIKAIVVNNDILAGEMIAQVFEHIKSDEEKTIVILSSNHEKQGNYPILMSQYKWKTPYGMIEADIKTIKKLAEDENFIIQEDIWQNEIGITNIVAFVKKTMPRAKIIPIMVRDSILDSKASQAAEVLKMQLPKDSLIISSTNFAKAVDKDMAKFQDEMSLAALSQIDIEVIDQLNVDGQGALKIFMNYLQKSDVQKFQVLNRADYALITGRNDVLRMKSYITGFWTSGEISDLNNVSILAFGDVMMDRYVRKIMDKKGVNYPFMKLKENTLGSDFVLANMEGAVSDFTPKTLHPNNLIFTFDPKTIASLKANRFNIFSLANNHSYNFGSSGLQQTIENLNKYKIDNFGHPLNKEDISLIKEVRGNKIAFVGYNELSTNNFDDVISEIKRIRDGDEADLIIFVPHWGIEYRRHASNLQREKAKKVIEAGADLIIGSHPHVVQPIEIINGKLVFYSLGNFLFDQTFSKETMEGLAIGASFSKSEQSFYLFPHQNNNFQIEFKTNEKKQEMLNFLADSSYVEEDIKKMIRNGIIDFK